MSNGKVTPLPDVVTIVEGSADKILQQMTQVLMAWGLDPAKSVYQVKTAQIIPESRVPNVNVPNNKGVRDLVAVLEANGIFGYVVPTLDCGVPIDTLRNDCRITVVLGNDGVVVGFTCSSTG